MKEGKNLSSYYEKNKKNGIKFRISFVILFIIASFAACFVLYMRSDDQSISGSGGIVVIPPSESAQETIEKISTSDINPIAEGQMHDSSYFDNCMFAGDSLIVGLGTYGIIPEERIAASIGMNVMSINTEPIAVIGGEEDEEALAADIINEKKPENLYILLGLNMLGVYTDEQMLASYGDFIDSIDRESTNIYIISVPPVTGERENDDESPILNTDIDMFNSDLLKFANNKCVYYIDLNTALKGSDGRFPEEYAESDGIHFKKPTYSIMLDFLLSHVYEEQE